MLARQKWCSSGVVPRLCARQRRKNPLPVPSAPRLPSTTGFLGVNDTKVRILTTVRKCPIILTAVYTARKEHTPLLQSLDDLQRERSRLQVALTQTDDLRPGSLVARFRKCGKPTCHCAKPDSPGHGPSYSLTREVESKTVTKIIPPSAVEQTQRSDRRVQAVSGLNSRFCRGQ